MMVMQNMLIHCSCLRTCTTPALRTHARYDTRVIRNKPRSYIAELYMTYIAQLVERSNVKRETRASTSFSSLYFSTILMTPLRDH